MTFLNPALLWGLAAVSIPIIIHIFNLRRTKKIEFSTLMFLKEIQQSKYKKLKLKQLLILLCRIAFVMLLVLAFSRPFEKGYLFSGSSKMNSSVLLVLDNSFSMQNRETQGSDFDAAKRKLIESLSLLGEDDEVFFASASDINKPNRNFVFKNIGALKDSVNNTKISDIARDFTSTMFYADRILESASNSGKEIFLFTDGQKSFYGFDAALQQSENLKSGAKLNIIFSGLRKGNNLSVDTVNVITRIFEKNKPVRLKCSVTNHNTFNVTNKSVALHFGNGKVTDEKVIDIPANSTVDVEFSFLPKSAGFNSGYINLLQKEIADDEISNDNRQYFTFYSPEHIKLLLAAGAPSDISYIRLALASGEELMKDSAGNKTRYYDIKEISSGDFGKENLAAYNTVVIANKPTFTVEESESIKKYIDDGGSVIIFPGANSKPDNYNSVLFKALDMPSVISAFNTAGTAPYKFESIDLGHPVFDGMFTNSAGAKESILRDSPEIKSGFEIVTGRNSQSLITLNGNKNFLVEYSRGKGKVLLFSSAADISASDFPLKSIFSPIIVRSILYLSPVNTIVPATVGKDYYFEPGRFIAKDSALVDIFSTAHDNITEGSFNYESANQNSLVNLKYFLNRDANISVQVKSSAVYSFPVNYYKYESNLDKFEATKLETRLKESAKIPANVIAADKPLSASVMELRTGRELWQYFLILALAFLAAEFFISRSIKS